MASLVESVSWPFALILSGVFIIAMFVILSGVSKDISFHTSKELAPVVASSQLHAWLNEENTKGFSHYERLTYEFCGKPNQQSLDWEAWNDKWNDPGDDEEPFLRPYFISYTNLSISRPSYCNEPAHSRTPLSNPEYGTEKDSKKTYTYQVKIPTRGADVITLSMDYQIRRK